MSGPLQLIPVEPDGAWNRLLRECRGAAPFHSAEWVRAVQNAVPQCAPELYTAQRGGETVGAWAGFAFAPAPLIAYSETLLWNLSGGFLPRPNSGPGDAADALQAWEAEARQKRRVGLRFTDRPGGLEDAAAALNGAGFALKERKTTHILHLPDDPERLWSGYKGNARTDIRKAEKSAVVVSENMREADSERETAAFYRIYADAMRRFKSPPKPLRLVSEIARPPVGQLLTARRNGETVGGILTLWFGEEASIWMAAGTLESRPYAVNRLLYHRALLSALRAGVRRVDFGASPASQPGLAAFKASFGAEPAPFSVWEKTLRPARHRLWRAAEPGARMLYRRLVRA